MLVQAQEMFAKVIYTVGGEHRHVRFWAEAVEYAVNHDKAVIDLLTPHLVGAEFSETDCDCDMKSATLRFDIHGTEVAVVTCGDDAEGALSNLVLATMPCYHEDGAFGYHWDTPDGTETYVELLTISPRAYAIAEEFILSSHITDQFAAMDTDEADQPYDEERLNGFVQGVAELARQLNEQE